MPSFSVYSLQRTVSGVIKLQNLEVYLVHCCHQQSMGGLTQKDILQLLGHSKNLCSNVGNSIMLFAQQQV